MNILDVLKLPFNSYQFKTYSVNDYATEIDLKFLIQNYEKIEDYYADKNGEINDLDQFADYLFLRKNDMLSEYKSAVVSEYLDQLETALSVIKTHLCKYKKASLIAYLKTNGIAIIENSKYNIKSAVFDLVFKYYSAFDKVLEYIAENEFHMLINRFEDYADPIIKIPAVCQIILDPKHFDSINQYSFEKYFAMVSYFAKRETYKESVALLLERIVNYGRSLFSSIIEKKGAPADVLYKEKIYKEVLYALKNIGYSAYAELEGNLPKIEEVLQDYLKEFGQEYSYEIPMQDVRKYLYDEKRSMQAKLLFLTHKKTKDNHLISYYSEIGAGKEKDILDMFASSIPCDEYLTATKQQMLDLQDSCLLNWLNLLINKQKIEEVFSTIATVLNAVLQNWGLNYCDLEFDKDLLVLLNMFYTLLNASKAKNDYLETGFNYAICMFEMALVEKLLRNLYIAKQKEKYIRSDWFSLGHLLDVSNSIMVELLGADNVKITSFYLVKYKNNFGHNYRNRYAHYKDIQIKDFNWGTTLKITHIFLTIINELSIQVGN